jgi:hypothetical protein|tara:strand:- start:610 stop:1569 length:960 start_codon:yes stop_codon:yes gene_type:complete
MEVTDVHVGKQLQCNFSVQGTAPVPPLCFGSGAAAVPGTGFFNGAVLVGSPLNFPIPNVPSANLMVGRALPVSNPLAAVAPSIFKVSNLGSILPPTPIDVMIGDPGKGIVGLSCNTEIINIVNATVTNIVSPITNGVGIFNWTGSKTLVGVEAITGAKAQAGAEARSGGKVINGATVINGALVVNGTCAINGFLTFSGSIVGTTKKFDIPHPTKKNHRLSHVCLEGPEAGVYYRGRLTNKSVIELPEYWKGLVDAETITVNLTPHGSYQELFVKSIEWGARINVVNNAGGAIDCSYVVYAERKDVDKLVVEYEGTEIKE